ncbi:serine/threonine-protein kinase [Mesoterricola silvestris]|uniref:Protein kinase domain-containing protein n=1 Tax=Mesoterricola silvestris TaxID=2927979 RepID=A0AA48GKM0_9BACT|nr:serine/threonine-protein kinase [Mesoterricola silvestris]BDU72954.1 hypothetical protein METEAL_21280 [Mesoterricola silvestris]
MSKLKTPATFETTFGSYEVTELIGEGGAGRVYGGTGLDGRPIALKVLSEERASKEKRGRFKNEIAFLARNNHPNIVTVLDHGIATSGSIKGPFYVMPRYSRSLRQLMKDGMKPGDVLPLFAQFLDGVEAAHLQKVVHRDLKPENILLDAGGKTPAIADFGIAKFNEDVIATLVETSPAQRLANFQYAAPEQRTPGKEAGVGSDLYALGLMLNEMYTGAVPHGTDYKTIASVFPEMGFLDEIVTKMLKQQPQDRPGSIAEIKALIQRYQSKAVSLQRLSKIDNTVIPEGKVDDPLAFEPPKLVNFDWDGENLTLILDRPVSYEWIAAVKDLRGSYSSVMGKGPETFFFKGNRATVAAQEYQVQQIIDLFKPWLPMATQRLRQKLEDANQRAEAERKTKQRQEREAEERRVNLLRNIRI